MHYYYPFKYNDEVFKPIPKELGFKESYIVGSCGTVINTETGKELAITLDARGYPRVSLKYADKPGGRNFLLHRLIMLTHSPIPNASEMTVNHKDGFKTNDILDNFEWLTSGDNTRHAFLTGLTDNNGEKSGVATFTNEEIYKVCTLLSQGVPYKEIALSIGREPSANIIRNLRSIHDRQSWNSISKDFIFPEYPNLRNSMTEDQARMACQILSQGGSYKDILIAFGIDPDLLTTEEQYNFCDVISNLRAGRYYKNISKEFANLSNDQKGRHDQILTYDEIHTVCKMLVSGCSIDDIITHLGYNSSNTDSVRLSKIRQLILRIRRRDAFRNISSQYGI